MYHQFGSTADPCPTDQDQYIYARKLAEEDEYLPYFFTNDDIDTTWFFFRTINTRKKQ